MNQTELDPQKAQAEEFTNHGDLQAETTEEVTNFALQQLETMEEVTNLSDPQLDPMEEVTNHEYLEPETMETQEAPTILDVLNADCWRVILDYLYINDILLTESVSRAWQQMVNEYLAGVHNYQVGSGDSEENQYDYHTVILKNNKESSKEFLSMIKRFGPLIVKLATNYITGNGYTAIAENCPNIEDLTLYTLQINALLQHYPEVYGRLKRLKLEWCDCLDGDCVPLMVLVQNMQELTINQFEIPATFMTALKWSQLKTLSINYCEYLLFDDRSEEFFSTVETNYILRKLVLNRNSTRVISDMCILIRNLPNLEELSIEYCKMMEPRAGKELVQAIRGLKNLQHLNMKRNNNVNDALLEAVARGCKNLRTLNIGYCVAVRGSTVAKMCQQLPKLTELYVAGVPKITDSHLIKCITACPKLKELDASGCARVSARLVAAARRAGSLRLRLVDTALTAPQVVEELSQGGRKFRLWAPVPGSFWTRKVTRMAQAGDLTLIWNENPVSSSSSSDQDISSDLRRVFKREKEEELSE